LHKKTRTASRLSPSGCLAALSYCSIFKVLSMKFYFKALLWFLFLVGITIVIKKYFDPSKREPKSIETEQIYEVLSDDDFSYRAFVISKSFIKENLKNPSTADFPFSDYRYNRVSTDQIIIMSYVDAQNSFGAKIRNNYKIELNFNGGEWTDESNWSVINLEFE
jgi:hypothetical protein